MRKVLSIILLCLLCLSCSTTPLDHPSEVSPSASDERDSVSDAELLGERQALSKTLVFAIGEYPPYTSAYLRNDGFFSEIVTEAYKAVEVDVKLEYYPWSRAWELMAHAEIDGSFPWTPTESRKASFTFSEPIVPFATSLLYMKGNQKVPKSFTTLESLKDLEVGGVEYYYYLEWFKDIDKDIDLSTNELDAIKKLTIGRFDIMPCERPATEYLIDSHLPDWKDQFLYLEPPVHVSQFHAVFSKKHPHADEYVDLFNEGFRIIKENGTFEEILKRHDVEYLYRSDSAD